MVIFVCGKSTTNKNCLECFCDTIYYVVSYTYTKYQLSSSIWLIVMSIIITAYNSNNNRNTNLISKKQVPRNATILETT